MVDKHGHRRGHTGIYPRDSIFKLLLRYEYGGCVYAAFVLSFLNYFLVLFMICAQVPGHRCLNICGDLDNLENAENAEVSFQIV